jgi:hypothetical protein
MDAKDTSHSAAGPEVFGLRASKALLNYLLHSLSNSLNYCTTTRAKSANSDVFPRLKDPDHGAQVSHISVSETIGIQSSNLDRAASIRPLEDKEVSYGEVLGGKGTVRHYRIAGGACC